MQSIPRSPEHNDNEAISPTDRDQALLVQRAKQLRQHLAAMPESELPMTYQALALALALPTPHSIHRLVQALELTMAEDAHAQRPFIAALVISRARGGLPAPGFFDLAARLGRHDGAESGAAAAQFHLQQMKQVLALRRQA